ncbi:MAG: hypothetical protein HY079_05705 [Elusimicrobia bacterium]|nr:hypothetical protein [Elusimicrobiota bacterium]
MTGLAVDAARRRLWAVGVLYASSGGAPRLFAAGIGMDGGGVLSFAVEGSSGTEAHGVAAAADGSAWIAGVSGGAPELWNADAAGGLQAWDALAAAGTANAVAAAPDGSVWVAGRDGDTGELAVWNDDPNTGTITQYGWTNGLGGTGSVGRAVALLSDGTVAVAGRAGLAGRRAATLWRLSGDYWLTTLTGGGAFDEDARGLALDDAGNAWVAGWSVVDAAGNAAFSLWEMTAAGSSLSSAATYTDSAYALTPYFDAGAAAAYSQGAVWSAGQVNEGRFAVWRHVLGTGNIEGTLAYAGGFGPAAQGIGFFVSPTASFNASPIQLQTAAPTDGSTTYAYVLSGLPAPATYYLAAVYDASGLLGQSNGVPSADPLGLYADDASGFVTQVTPVFVPAGGGASGVDFTLAVDRSSPTPVVGSPASGSTMTAASFALYGSASDDTSVVNLQLGLLDATAGLWWDGSGFTSAAQTNALNPQVSGPVNAATWSLSPSDQSAARAALTPGHQYAVALQAADLVGNASTLSVPFVVVSTASGPSSGRGFARGPDGSFWVVSDDGGPSVPRLERRASDGSFLSSTTLTGAVAQDAFWVAFDASGNVWVDGTSSVGLGLWKLDPTGQSVLASPTVNGGGVAGRLAADAGGAVWVPVAEPGGNGFQYSLYKFDSAGVLAAGFPVSYQRGGDVDGGLAAAVDASGSVWVAGVSSNPASGRLDVGVWKHDSAGVLQSGYPKFWPQSFADLNSIQMSAVLAQGKLWIAAQKSYDSCAAGEAALVSYDASSGVFGAKLWHDAAGAGAALAGVDADASGAVWASGQAAGVSLLWKYAPTGALAAGFPRAHAGAPFDPRFVQVDAAGRPWVLDGNAPEPFTGGASAAGATGSPACALAGQAQVSGTVSYAGGFPAADFVTLAVSTSPILGATGEPALYAVPTAGGTSLSYTLTLPAPAVYYIVAVDTPSAQSLQPGTPIAPYAGYAPVSVTSGAAVTGVDIALAVDNTPPTSRVTSLVDGSTISALSAIAGTAADATGVDRVELAVHDLTFDVWWNASAGQWQASGTPVFQGVQSSQSGTSAALSWLAAAGGGSFGGLNGVLAKGHQYRVFSQSRDFTQNQESATIGPAFVWNGPNGSVTPPSPQNVFGSALGVSSISWTWSASVGATGYQVFLGSSASLGATTQTSFVTTAHSTDAAVTLCVAATNSFGAGAQNCSPTAYTLAAVPGAPYFTAGTSTTLTAAWDAAGNPAYANYTAVLSTDGFVTTLRSVSSNQPQSFFADLSPATGYSLRVTAVNGNGFVTEPSPAASTQTAAAPPPAPQGLAGAPLGVSSVSWTWSAVSGADGYLVTSTAGAALADTPLASYETTGLSTNTPAAVCVAAHSSAGAGPSACAGANSAAAVPGAPVFTFASPDSFVLGWDAAGNPFATPYQVELSRDGFASDLIVAVPFSASQTFTTAFVPGLTPDTVYQARVRAANALGVITDPSPAVSTRTLLAPPSAPTSLTAAADAPARVIRLSWQAPAAGTPAAAYQVYRGVSADTNTITALAVTTATAFADSPYFSATYYYQVAALNADSVAGPRSDPASAALDLVAPATVADLRITAVRAAPSEVDLAWTAVADDFSGVERYEVSSSSAPDLAGAVVYTVPQATAGSTATLTVPIPAGQARYFTVVAVDGAGNRSFASPTLTYDPVPPALSSIGLTQGQSLSRPLNLSIQASDNVGVAWVSLSADGVFLSSGPAWAPLLFDTRVLADGPHDVAVSAYDAAGNSSSSTVAVTVSYAPPATPSIASPSSGFGTSVGTITVQGYAEDGTGVDVQVNGLDAATATVRNGVWSVPDMPLGAEGDVTLTAIAFEPRGFSSPSAGIAGTYATHAPGAPELVSGLGLSNGQVQVSWSAPSTGKRPTYYRVYRSTDDAVLAAGSASPFTQLSAQLVAARVTVLQFTETPALDDLYFYGVTSVDGAGNESPLSEISYVLTDRVPPAASVQFSTAQPVGVGVYAPLFALSEALASPPILTLTAPGASPVALNAEALTPTLWRATVTVDASMGAGAALFAFQGTDLSGNVGTALSSATLLVDTVGPSARAALSRPSPLAAGPLTVTLTLDEPAGTPPTLTLTPHAGAPGALVTVQASTDATVWTAVLTVTAATGDGVATLAYQGQDALGNVGTALTGTASFTIDTAAPPQPLAVRANPLPKGLVALSWSAGLGEPAAYYNVYRDGVLLSTRVVPASDGTGAYVDAPGDGPHSHAVSAVDAAGNESALTDPVSIADSAPPPSPDGLAAAVDSFGQVRVDWVAGSTDTAGYRLYRTTYTLTLLNDVPSRAAVPPFLDAPPFNATWHYVVTALDAVGNESDGAPEAVVVYSNAAPVVTVAGVTDGGYYRTPVAPAFAAEDLTLDTSTVHATLDGQPFLSGSAVNAEGAHQLVVSAANAGGHQRVVTTFFTLDFTPPQVAFSVADRAALVSTTPVAVLVTPSDLHLASTAYTLVNQTLGASAPYDSGAPISRNGSYVLTAVAADLAGNVSTTTLSFTLEAGPIAPAGLAVRVQSGARLSWTAPEPGIAGYRVYRDGGHISASLVAETAFQDPGYAPGAPHVYEVAAVDAAGVEGPRARAAVPAATLSLAPVTLTRGYFDALHPVVANAGASSLAAGPALLTVTDAAGRTLTSTAPAAAVAAGQSAALEGVVATPADMGSAQLHAAVTLPTDPGAAVTLEGDFPLSAADPAQPTVEVLPGALVTGTLSPVQVRFYNRGTAPLDLVTAQVAGSTFAAVDDVQVLLKTPEGTVLSAAGIRQTGDGANAAVLPDRQVFFVTVPPGQSLLLDPVQVSVPNTALTSLSVSAAVSTPTYSLPFLRLPGTRSFSSAVTQGTVAQVPYTATVRSDRSFYDQGSSVTLTGQALDTVSGNPVPNATVGVHVLNNGFDRPFSAVTDSSGVYRTAFFPLPNEAGAYALSAGHPAVVSRAVQSSFTIVGLALQYTGYTATLAQNSTYRFTVDLTNTGASDVTGLSASSAPLTGSGVTLALDPATLPASLAAGAKAVLGLTVAAAPLASSSTLTLTVTEGHGFIRVLPVTATVVPAQVIPAVTPDSFSIGMVGGDSRELSVVIKNQGFDTWRGVQLTAPALSWVSIQGLTTLGDIPPGGNANLTLRFDPPSTLSNGTYQPVPLLQITSLNVPPVPVVGAIAITSARKGDVLVNVIDADKPRGSGGQGVPVAGARATLTSLDVSGLSFTVAADANGLAPFSQVPSGKYAWRAEAQGYQTVSGTAIIEPGLTNKIEAILPTATVSYTWTVTPTTIQDKYNITLNLSFLTNVPAPAIVVDPPLAQINIDVGQSAYGQYTLTNKGMVSVFNYKLTPATDDGLAMELPFTTIPEIKPGQSVVVPYKFTYIHHSDPCKQASVAQQGDYWCAEGSLLGSAGNPFKASVGPQIQCGGDGSGGGTSGGGGGGGGGWAVGGSAVSVVPSASGSGCNFGGGLGFSHWLQNKPCGGASPLDGSHYQPPAFGFGFPGPVAPFFGPGYNSLDPAGVNPPDGTAGASANPPGWAPPAPTVQASPDGQSVTQTNPDGSRELIVPTSDLKQPSNGGSGSAMSVPPGDIHAWSTGIAVAVPGRAESSFGLTSTDANGTVTTFAVYGSSTYLPVSIVDRNGNKLTYTREDPTGRLLRMDDSFGRWIAFTYNPQGQMVGASDSAGRSASYAYDAQGNKTAETDFNGDTTHYDYDANHRMTQITYPNNGHMTLAYDGAGRVSTEQEDGGNNKRDYAYYASSTAVVDALGRTTLYNWTQVQGIRRFTSIVDPSGGSTVMTYDAGMNLASITDPLGRTTQLKYDAKNNPTSVSNALGQTVQATYDPVYSQPQSITDAKGNVTRISYDAKGNAVSIQDALNGIWNFGYDAQGHLTAARDPLGDSAGFTYNAQGDLVGAVDPLSLSYGFGRDALGRLTRFTSPTAKHIDLTYDPTGNLTQFKDALNGVTNYGYQSGRLGGRLLQSLTDANNHQQSFGYDVMGRPTSVTNALGQAITIAYDVKGNPTQITNRKNQTILPSRDVMDRITQVGFPEGNVSITYDGVGNMSSLTGADGAALSLTYDSLYRVSGLQATLNNGFSDTLSFTYDANGNRTAMTSPSGNFSATYDALDRLTSVGGNPAGTFHFTYDARGKLTSMLYPNATKATFAYDAAGRITQIVNQKVSNQAAIAFTNYTYDSEGNRTVVADLAGAHVYTYDALNRLTSASHPSAAGLPVLSETFSYDPLGLRTADALRSAFVYDAANRIVSDSSMTYTSDASGNRTSQTGRASGQTTTFKYDSHERLTEVDGPGSAVLAAYKFDPMGRRIEKSAGGVVTRYLYDGTNIRAILDGSNNELARLTYLPGLAAPLAMEVLASQNGFVAGTYYFHLDALGNVVALTDGTGAVVETYAYQAYGRAVVKDAQGGLHDRSTVGNPFMFAGTFYDAETGLYHMSLRDQDPDTGLFLQEDPLPNLSPYLYASDNPVRWVDTLGMCTDNAFLNAIGGFGNGLSLGMTGDQGGFYNSNSGAFKVASLVGGFVSGYLVGAAAEAAGTALGGGIAALQGGAKLAGAEAGAAESFGAGAASRYEFMSSEQAKNLIRFERKLPANAGPTYIYDLPSGGKAFQAESAASKIPGSYATYEKQVDALGNTIQYTKTTYDPLGKIVHVKDKLTGVTYYP